MNSENKTNKPSAAANLMQLMSFTADKALEMADANSIIGDRIEVDGMTIIPVSKVSAGFAGGGANIVNAEVKKSNTPSGSGAKVTVTPMSFLVIRNGCINVINVNVPEKANKGNILSMIVEAAKGLKIEKKNKKDKDGATDETTVVEDAAEESR